MKTRPKVMVASILSVMALFAALWMWLPRGTVEEPKLVDPSLSPLVPSQTGASSPEVLPDSPIEAATRALGSPSPRGITLGTLSALRSNFDRMPKPAASRLIQSFLDSRKDLPTGLGFRIGEGGSLAESPTLRIFLLDYLGAIDPTGAAEYGRKILAEMGSADEWAVAMRNVARGDNSDGGRAFLSSKFRALLAHGDWQREASVGYLEAFDVAVYLRDAELAPELAKLVAQKENRAAAHAAYLALDRLIIVEGSSTLGKLDRDRELLKERERTRADYLARADVREPGQRELLESFLLDPASSAVELEQFTGIYPNANYMVSKNLLTVTATPGHGELRARDAEALRWVNVWLVDPRFAHRKRELDRLKRRLEGFLNQPATSN